MTYRKVMIRIEMGHEELVTRRETYKQRCVGSKFNTVKMIG
jgi:hypothetical protein